MHAGKAVLFESAHQSLKAIQSLPSYEHMVLQPFTTAEVQQYMRVALDRHNISNHIAAAVRERTGGLPLYVEQVCCLPEVLSTPKKAIMSLVPFSEHLYAIPLRHISYSHLSCSSS